MSIVKSDRSGSRRTTALLLALAMALVTVPAFAAEPGQEDGFRVLPRKVFSFDWSFLEILGDLFRGSPEPVQSIQAQSGVFEDPDGQPLVVVDFSSVVSTAQVSQSVEQ